MGHLIDFREARAVKTAKAALERRMEAERSRANVTDVIDWQSVSMWDHLHGIRLTGPGGIDDLEF